MYKSALYNESSLLFFVVVGIFMSIKYENIKNIASSSVLL